MRPDPIERDAIVVGRQDLGENDRIFRFLTPTTGRLSAVGHGARAARSRWTGLDIGTRARIASRPGRGDLERLVSVEVDDPRIRLRNGLGRLALAVYACELCGALAREGHAETRLYGLLDTALLLLDATDGDPAPAFCAALEGKALTFAGIAPVLDRCVACADVLEENMAFAPGAGGLVHARCAVDAGATWPVSSAVAAALEAARRAPLRDSLDLGLPPGPADVLSRAVTAHLGRPLASRVVLEALLH